MFTGLWKIGLVYWFVVKYVTRLKARVKSNLPFKISGIIFRFGRMESFISFYVTRIAKRARCGERHKPDCNWI